MSRAGSESTEVGEAVTINGRLCIAPFYAGVDADTGLILKKEGE